MPRRGRPDPRLRHHRHEERRRAARLAAHLAEPNRDVTYVFYDHEEVEADKNGLGRAPRNNPDWLAGDFAVLLEPTNATVEGCCGTMRADVVLRGHRAHSARSWLGSNAVHAAVRCCAAWSRTSKQVEIDGLVYREGLDRRHQRGVPATSSRTSAG